MVLWVIVQAPELPGAMIRYSARIFVALHFQVIVTTEQVPEDFEMLWRACQEEHGLPTKPNRCRLSCPCHALVARASAPSMTWPLLCTQVCSADHEGSALPNVVW